MVRIRHSAVAMIAIAALSLAACSSNASPTAGSSGTTDPATQSQTPTEGQKTEKPTAKVEALLINEVQGTTLNPVPAGQIESMTGAFEKMGQSVQMEPASCKDASIKYTAGKAAIAASSDGQLAVGLVNESGLAKTNASKIKECAEVTMSGTVSGKVKNQISEAEKLPGVSDAYLVKQNIETTVKVGDKSVDSKSNLVTLFGEVRGMTVTVNAASPSGGEPNEESAKAAFKAQVEKINQAD